MPVVAPINYYRSIKVGARGSSLSIAQTLGVIERLKQQHPELLFEFIPIKTSGDDPKSSPYGHQGLKGLFVKEIETALLKKEIDLAVHSAKDLASELPAGLILGPALERAEPWDVTVSSSSLSLASLPIGAKVGTSSLRRQFFIKAFRRDLDIQPLRGNVETRLKKVGQTYSAIILAKAGLSRLNIQAPHLQVEIIPPEIMLPSPGQGQLALEFRADNDFIHSLVKPLNHLLSALAMEAERAFMRRLGLGCTEPVAALCTVVPKCSLVMKAALVEVSKMKVIRAEKSCTLDINVPLFTTDRELTWSEKISPNKDNLLKANELGKAVASSIMDKASDDFKAAHIHE
ncbi:MAG: hydroxymethylbilane synthase [Deltaproteobacteria bacterium]|nr:hydroxymethylbilane synthase [Deltaproteobacteria bacterium]